MTGSAAREPTSDIEIVAQTVRYARAAAPEVRAKTILRRLVNDFPDIERSRILGCMRTAAELMLEQHS